MKGRLVGLMLAWGLVAPTAWADDPSECRGVKFVEGDFGGPLTYEARGMYELLLGRLVAKDDGKFVLTVAVQSQSLTTVIVPAGATYEVALEDGTVFKDQIMSAVPGALMSTGAGSTWEASMELDLAQVKKLGETELVNSRLTVQDVSVGTKWKYSAWTKKFMKAAACMAAKAPPESAVPSAPSEQGVPEGTI